MLKKIPRNYILHCKLSVKMAVDEEKDEWWILYVSDMTLDDRSDMKAEFNIPRLDDDGRQHNTKNRIDNLFFGCLAYKWEESSIIIAYHDIDASRRREILDYFVSRGKNGQWREASMTLDELQQVVGEGQDEIEDESEDEEGKEDVDTRTVVEGDAVARTVVEGDAGTPPSPRGGAENEEEEKEEDGEECDNAMEKMKKRMGVVRKKLRKSGFTKDESNAFAKDIVLEPKRYNKSSGRTTYKYILHGELIGTSPTDVVKYCKKRAGPTECPDDQRQEEKRVRGASPQVERLVPAEVVKAFMMRISDRMVVSFSSQEDRTYFVRVGSGPFWESTDADDIRSLMMRWCAELDLVVFDSSPLSAPTTTRTSTSLALRRSIVSETIRIIDRGRGNDLKEYFRDDDFANKLRTTLDLSLVYFLDGVLDVDQGTHMRYSELPKLAIDWKAGIVHKRALPPCPGPTQSR